MKFKVQKSYWYIPEFNDNRDLPETEQLRVKIKIPNFAEIDELSQLIITDNQGAKSTYEYKRNNALILSRHITKIVNLVIETEKNEEKTIDNGEKLKDLTLKELKPLVEEIAGEVIRIDDKKEEEEEIKNS
jgi:hypothetical protein